MKEILMILSFILIWPLALLGMKVYRSLPLLLGKNHSYTGPRFQITTTGSLLNRLIILFDKKKNKTYTSEHGIFWFSDKGALNMFQSAAIDEAYVLAKHQQQLHEQVV